MSPGTKYALMWIAAGTVAGAAYGAIIHPGPQASVPLGEQVVRSGSWGALAASVVLGTTVLGVRMGALPA